MRPSHRPKFISPTYPVNPLLFDFQVNGFAGVDFQKDDLRATELVRAMTALRHDGVGAIFATLVTAEIDALCRRFERLERLCAAEPAIKAMVVGYHLEGPWLSPREGFRGAHPRDLMCAPLWADFERLQEAAGGRIRLVTIAPELRGAIEFITELSASGVHVALGHTDASDADIDGAVAAGARFVTHLGNGCPQMLPRHDNVIQRLLARDELTACLIPDGVHLPPFVLQNLFRAKPAGKVLFTTDAMAGAAAGPGTYTLGQSTIRVGADGVARNPQGAGFAGSTLTPSEGVRLVAEFLRLENKEAHRLWSEAPARAFGLLPL